MQNVKRASLREVLGKPESEYQENSANWHQSRKEQQEIIDGFQDKRSSGHFVSTAIECSGRWTHLYIASAELMLRFCKIGYRGQQLLLEQLASFMEKHSLKAFEVELDWGSASSSKMLEIKQEFHHEQGENRKMVEYHYLSLRLL